MNFDPPLILAIISLSLAGVPLVIFLLNLGVYRPPQAPINGTPLPSVSVLIPARNEEHAIRAAVESVLASRGVALEVIVLDDHSEDATPRVVHALAENDSRIRLESALPLPSGWCGKQHACHQLAGLARFTYLVFLDADVRLAPDALARMVHFMETERTRPRFHLGHWLAGKPAWGPTTRYALASGVPRQVTGTWLEQALIPLIHFVLMGFLPMRWMRSRVSPAYGAGCGQLFIARAEDYRAVQPHRQIRGSLHDGVKLPRAFRGAGFMTGLFDATTLATCRMYHGAGETWRGLGKNAIEGLAAPNMIGGMTALLGFSQVAPWALLPFATGAAFWIALAAAVVSITPRWLAAWRFKQSPFGALLHPLGIVLLLAIQWQAFARWWLKIPSAWKGRNYGGVRTGEVPAVKRIQPARANS
jgi:hypothetical protein